MADKPLTLVMNTATFRVGTDTYTEHIASAEYVPNTPTQEVTDISGTVHRVSGKAGWTLNLGLIQDWSAGGLATMFLDQEGEVAEVTVVRPDATFTSEVTIVAPSIGGAGNAIAQSALALPSSKPTRAAAPSGS